MIQRLAIGILFLLTFSVNIATGESNMIENGKTVKFEYTLTVNGELVDSSQSKGPLEYVHGQGMIIPGLEKEMEGLTVGDARMIVVAPENAYGSIDQNLVRELPKSILAEGVEPQVGEMLQMQDKEGNIIPAIILEVRDDTLILNFNHPLAGQELKFEVTVVEIK